MVAKTKMVNIRLMMMMIMLMMMMMMMLMMLMMTLAQKMMTVIDSEHNGMWICINASLSWQP